MKRRKGWMAAAAWITAVSLTGCGMSESLLKTAMEMAKEAACTEAGNQGKSGERQDTGVQVQAGNTAQGGLWETECETYIACACEMAEADACAEQQIIVWNTEEYDHTPENGWKSAAASPLSTFAADVDTASYANVRRMILRGDYLPADAVRVEEMINYFHYDYPEPEEGEPFSVTTKIAPCPWNPDTQLLQIGLNTKEIAPEEHVPSNLVFLIDVSGSMDEPDKLPLVQRSFKMLAETLRPEDKISIVTYASWDEVVLDGATGEEGARIRQCVDDLMAGGGTNGSDGILTAYELAEKHFIEGGNNRVILATDGDLNIGITDEGSLTRLVQEKAAGGIMLSVLGFGTGNLSDARMEAMADNGNGNYSYIDSISEARKVLVSEMGGTLFTVAKDVKLQVEFNPAHIKGYRQIGYENRQMAAEAFADDTKDGGEIGAGHQVTVLYEIAPVGSAQEIYQPELRYGSANKEGASSEGEQADTEESSKISEKEQGNAEEGSELSEELLNINIRYKKPSEDVSTLCSYPVTQEAVCETMDSGMQWAAAVAGFGMILRESEYCGGLTCQQVHDLAAQVQTAGDAYQEEFLYLVNRYAAQ